ncbi:MAG: glycosyltransferase family 4 protein [bacterium]
MGITGRVTEQKGQVYFVKAAELLLKSGLKAPLNKPLKFHIVGNGKDEKVLKNMVKKMGISDNFRFWGYQRDVKIFVDMFDIAVSCSLNEPFGINNIEYMFMKKPCIATSTGGIPEIYGNTNIIVPPKDTIKLKEAIEMYIKNPDVMEKEAMKGFKRADRLFKADISANRIISIYEDMRCATAASVRPNRSFSMTNSLILIGSKAIKSTIAIASKHQNKLIFSPVHHLYFIFAPLTAMTVLFKALLPCLSGMPVKIVYYPPN